MMRIALITLHTPTATNCGGASALPYHLLAFRPEGTDAEVWSFNLNGCSAEQIAASEARLGVRIHTVARPRWFRLLGSAAVRLLLPKPVLAYLPLPADDYRHINEYLSGGEPALWIYGEDIARLARRFNGIPTVITTPDCEAMYYHRVLGMQGVPLSIKSMLRYALMYHRYASMAAHYPAGPHIRYHLVGHADARFLKRINPSVEVRFLRHPHYDVANIPHTPYRPGTPIKLLIAGRYDFTMAQAADEAFAAMKTLPQNVKDKFLITFLGKGWASAGEGLRQAGFKVSFKGYVDDYAAELASHHIQLTPVAVGTGTKGKVLDAFANGLMVIGTPLALENIAAERGTECIEYSDGDELIRWLCRIAGNTEEINHIAAAGRDAVLLRHGRGSVAAEFFQMFR